MINRVFLDETVFLLDCCFSLFLHSFQSFQSTCSTWLIESWFQKKKITILPPQNSVVCCESERNETVFLWSGSSKRGWEIFDPQNYCIQQGFRTRSFQCLELFLYIYYCQFLVPRMQEWLSEQHRSFAAGLWLPYITMALECSKIYMNICIRWEFYVQPFIYYVW